MVTKQQEEQDVGTDMEASNSNGDGDECLSSDEEGDSDCDSYDSSEEFSDPRLLQTEAEIKILLVEKEGAMIDILRLKDQVRRLTEELDATKLLAAERKNLMDKALEEPVRFGTAISFCSLLFVGEFLHLSATDFVEYLQKLQFKRKQ